MILKLLSYYADRAYCLPDPLKREATNAIGDAIINMALATPLEIPRIMVHLGDRIQALQQQADALRRTPA
jgi:hypothetical protein